MSARSATIAILTSLRAAATTIPPRRFGVVVPAPAPAPMASDPNKVAPAVKREAKRYGKGQRNVAKLAPKGWRLSLLRKRSPNVPYKQRRVSETKRLRRLASKAWAGLDMLKPALTAARRQVADLAHEERLQRMTVEDARRMKVSWLSLDTDDLRHANTELGRIVREHTKAQVALGELNYQWHSLVKGAHSAYKSASTYSNCGMLYIDEVMEGRANTREARLAYRSNDSDWRMLFDAGVRKGLKKRLNKQARKVGYRSAMLDFDDEMTPTPGERREAQRIARAEEEQAAAYNRMMEREIQAMLDEDVWGEAA